MQIVAEMLLEDKAEYLYNSVVISEHEQIS